MTLSRSAIRFVLTGGMVTGVHVVITVALVELLQVAPPTANALAFTLATLLSYMVNTLWSFSARLTLPTLLRFVTVSLVGCGLTYGISALAQSADLHYLVGVALVVMAIPPATFLMHRHWTYR